MAVESSAGLASDIRFQLAGYSHSILGSFSCALLHSMQKEGITLLRKRGIAVVASGNKAETIDGLQYCNNKWQE